MEFYDLVLEINGEVVERADPHIGLFIEAQKNLIEYKTLFTSSYLILIV
jgi:NADH:ubiquinone oxidoreductase subunit D